MASVLASDLLRRLGEGIGFGVAALSPFGRAPLGVMSDTDYGPAPSPSTGCRKCGVDSRAILRAGCGPGGRSAIGWRGRGGCEDSPAGVDEKRHRFQRGGTLRR